MSACSCESGRHPIRLMPHKDRSVSSYYMITRSQYTHSAKSNDVCVWSPCVWCDRLGSDSHLQETTHQAFVWRKNNHKRQILRKQSTWKSILGKFLSHCIVINDSGFGEVFVFNLLGLMIDNKLSWNEHVEFMIWYVMLIWSVFA